MIPVGTRFLSLDVIQANADGGDDEPMQPGRDTVVLEAPAKQMRWYVPSALELDAKDGGKAEGCELEQESCRQTKVCLSRH